MGDGSDEWLREERRRRALSQGAGARRVRVVGGDERRLQRLRAGGRGGMSLPSGDITFLAVTSGVAALLTGVWLWYRKQPVSAVKVESHYLHGIDVTAAGS